MKTLKILACILLTQCCFAQSHEFEGKSEIYNIRSPKVLAEFLPENPVIIEAGAYQGRDTVKLAQKFPNARIYAFEPLITAFPKLSEAVSQYANVTAFNMALDQVSGIKPFYICHGTYAQNPIFEFHSSLLKPLESSAVHLLGPVELVSCVSLLDFAKAEKINKIDMLWLSTEGNELQVLRGAGRLLKKVSLVYVHSQLYPTRESITLFKELRAFMEKNDFILLSHFYLNNIHGDALFAKKEKCKSCGF